MEYLFTIFAIVWIVFNLPVPPVGGVGMGKLIIGLVGIILLVLVLFGFAHPSRAYGQGLPTAMSSAVPTIGVPPKPVLPKSFPLRQPPPMKAIPSAMPSPAK